MVFIDGTIVNVALPVLQSKLNATVADAQWVVEAYALLLAALLLVGGSLGDIYGRRRIFIIGTVIFTVASIWCGLSPNVGSLIAARAIQGIGGALLTPNSLAIISAAFSNQERSKAIGTWSGFTSITSVIGPVLGGFLIQVASWRFAFFINFPLAIAVIAVMIVHVPETRDTSRTLYVDLPGAILATLGLGGIILGLIDTSSYSIAQVQVWLPLVAGIGFAVAFLYVEAHSDHAMMPLGIFRSRTFSGANILTFLLYGALGGVFFFVPFNLQQVQGYSPFQAGAALVPFALIVFALSRWAGGLITRFGAKLPLIIGPSLVGIGFLLYARPTIGGPYWFTYFPAILINALGMAITIAPLTTSVMNSVDSGYMGVASGVNNAVSRAAALLFVAVLGLVVFQVFNHALNTQLATAHISPAIQDAINSQRSRLAAIVLPKNIDSAQASQLHHSINMAFVSAFRVCMLIGSGFAFGSAAIAAWLVDGKKQ